jgi:hypothetical protein
MFTTEEFRTRIYSYYEENGIVVGDPSVGNWERAHIVPQCKGGTETVLLLHGHHIMHDLYQSREYSRKTFWNGNTYSWLYGEGFLCENWFELAELYDYYSSRNAADRWAALDTEERTTALTATHAASTARWASMTPEERCMAMTATHAANKARWAAMTPEERSAEMSRRTRLGLERKRALRSLGADLYGALWAAEPM